MVSDYARSYSFYTKYFNLRASDILTAPDGMHISAFMHIDRGEEFTDHHTMFLSMSPRVGVHHCSFEVNDPDIQAIGHDVSGVPLFPLAGGRVYRCRSLG